MAESQTRCAWKEGRGTGKVNEGKQNAGPIDMAGVMPAYKAVEHLV